MCTELRVATADSHQVGGNKFVQVATRSAPASCDNLPRFSSCPPVLLRCIDAFLPPYFHSTYSRPCSMISQFIRMIACVWHWGHLVPDGLYTPPRSSHSNTIEHLWAEVERELKKRKRFHLYFVSEGTLSIISDRRTYVYETLRRETRSKVHNLAVSSNYIMRNILREVTRPSISKLYHGWFTRLSGKFDISHALGLSST